MVARCKATNERGSPCSAQPIRRSGFCYWHCPQAEAQRTEARRRGGAQRSNKARARRRYADGALSPAEIEGLIGTTMKAVIAGRVEPGVGNAVASLARAAVAVREVAELEGRIAALERAADEARRWTG